MARGLTKKQKTFVKEMAKTGNGTQAALIAYDISEEKPQRLRENLAASIASENLTKPKIVNALEQALPDELLAQVHQEGLLATKPIYKQTSEYKWVKVGDEEDFGVRHKYLDTAYKIKGSYATEKSVNLNMNVDVTELKEMLLSDIERFKGKQ